jgi:hypothetical protein
LIILYFLNIRLPTTKMYFYNILCVFVS